MKIGSIINSMMMMRPMASDENINDNVTAHRIHIYLVVHHQVTETFRN